MVIKMITTIQKIKFLVIKQIKFFNKVMLDLLLLFNLNL